MCAIYFFDYLKLIHFPLVKIMEVIEKINSILTGQICIIKIHGLDVIYKFLNASYDAANDIILISYRKFQVDPNSPIYLYSGIITVEFIYHCESTVSIKNDTIDWIDINDDIILLQLISVY